MNRPIVTEQLSSCNEDYIDECKDKYEKYIDYLEKALIRACELISHLPTTKGVKWREWLLKDEQHSNISNRLCTWHHKWSIIYSIYII